MRDLALTSGCCSSIRASVPDKKEDCELLLGQRTSALTEIDQNCGLHRGSVTSGGSRHISRTRAIKRDGQSKTYGLKGPQKVVVRRQGVGLGASAAARRCSSSHMIDVVSHLSNTEVCLRYEYPRRINDAFNLPKIEI